MKTKLLFTFACAVALAVVLSTFVESRSLNPSPTARSGGPGDISGATANRNCGSTCHNTYEAVLKGGWVTSDIPATGYVPGQTYNITVSVSSPAERYGFTASCQDADGNFHGKLIMNNETWIIDDADKSWIYHRDSTSAVANSLQHSIGYAGSGGFKSWTFGWTAPDSGTGNLTFYASMVAGDGNKAASNDSVFISTLEVTEGQADPGNPTGIISYSLDKIRVFPNPSNGNFQIQDLPPTANVEIFNMTGQSVFRSVSEESKVFVNLPGNPTGIHIIRITDGNQHKVMKVLIR